jgi:peptidoglycan/xylan/chitin deacetylase (PgdA/CDA1 family)
MSEFVERLERGALPNAAVAVTFDDGYVDNLRDAKPRLAAAGLPATLFLTTGAVGKRIEYWWDELARSILGHSDALECEIVICGKPTRLAFGPADAEGARQSAWRAWEEPRTERDAAYVAIWRRLRELSAADRDAAMTRIREALGASPPDPNDMPMTANEIAELAADGVFDLGGHTVTHPMLPTLAPAERRREILEGKRACERLVNRSVGGFAYPHGAIDADSLAAVHECGFMWACSTHSCPVSAPEYDRYALPRMAVLDWDGAAFEHALLSACA